MSAKKKAPAVQEQASLMYLGPTITGVVRHSTNFKNGALPEKVRECINQFPVMQKLFVPLVEMPAAIKELNKEQSALKTIYHQVAKKFK